MRRIARAAMGLLIVLISFGQCAAQQQRKPASAASPPAAAAKPATKPAAAKPAAARPDPARMDAILQAWETQSQNTRTIHAKLERVDFAHDWETQTFYVGDAYLQSPNLAYLNFNKYDEGTKSYAFNERIVCTPSNVYQFLAETKQVQIYELAKNQRQRAMEEGPLPFLFNMKADEARQRYAMTLLQEDDKECFIRIEPRQQLDRDAFSVAYIWLDKKGGIPTKIRLMDPANGKSYKHFKLTEIKRNEPISLKYFQGLEQARQVAAKGWSIIEHPAQPPAAEPAAAPPRVGQGQGPIAPARKPAGPARR